MTERSCSTCEFYSAMHSQCRAEPPKAMVVPTETGPQITGMFPPMGRDGWCGRWEPDDNQPAPNGHRAGLRIAS